MTPAPPRFLGGLLAALLAAGRPADAAFVCHIPTAGCVNGMFSVELCQCECIPPYCLYEYDGTCSLPSGACDNPWEDCEPGVDCPWWTNPAKDETCTTGPKIPANVWNLYNTQSACCNVNFLYSTMCLPNQTPDPTRFPTIKRVKQSFEVIPLKFFFQDMPDGDLPLADLKEELINILKRILIRFSDTVPALVISSVEERVFLTRQLLLRRTDEEARRPTAAGLAAVLGRHLSSWTRKLLRRPPRDLGQDLDLYFNVKVVRDPDGKRFGPMIIEEIKRSFQEIADDLQSFAATQGYGPEVNFGRMNFCTSEDGQFTTCKLEIIRLTPAPTRAALVISFPDKEPTMAPSAAPSPGPKEGLSGWAIALIFMACLCLFCVVGYFVCAALAGGSYNSEEHYNNFYANEEKNLGWKAAGRSDRSRGGDKHDETRVVLNEPQIVPFEHDAKSYGTRRSKKKRREPRVLVDGFVGEDRMMYHNDVQNFAAEPQIPFDDDIDFSAYGTKKVLELEDEVRAPQIPFDDGSIHFSAHGKQPSAQNLPIKPGRDPTFYVLGEEDRPNTGRNRDADGDVGSRKYLEGEDPSLKPKRDPTQYGGTIYGEDPSLRPKRDPTMYGGGGSTKRDPTMYGGGGSIYDEFGEDSAADSPLKLEREPTVYFDEQLTKHDRSNYSFGPSFLSATYNDSYLGKQERSESFVTREPARSVSSKRSKASKKSRRSHRR